MNLTPRKQLFVETAAEMFGDGSILSRVQVDEARKSANVPWPTWFIKPENRVGSGMYKLPAIGFEVAPAIDASTIASAAPMENTVVNLVATNMEKQNLVPAKFEGFVSWGNFSLIEKVVKSGKIGRASCRERV